MTPAPTMQPGFPTRAYLAERYAKRTGADISNLSSWVALAHFKSAAIAQGIAARVRAGSMAGQDFGDIESEVERVATEGWPAREKADRLLTDRDRPPAGRRSPGCRDQAAANRVANGRSQGEKRLPFRCTVGRKG